MKTYKIPAAFDGGKFAARYGLNAFRGDFWVIEDNIFVPDNLPDDPPIFDPPDPPKPGLASRLDAVKNLPDLIQLLKEELH